MLRRPLASRFVGAQYAQVAAAPGFETAPLGFGLLDRSRRLSYGVGKRLEVVVRRLHRLWVRRKPEYLPPARCGKSLGVELAQVVTVRLGVDGEWPEYRGLVGVHIRQRGDGLARTGST